jgi:hypothetical protein
MRAGPAEIQRVASYFPGVTAQTTNMRFPKGVSELGKPTYEHALAHLADSMELLQPATSFRAIVICCTSFSFAVGADRIAAEVAKVVPRAPVVSMADALVRSQSPCHRRSASWPHIRIVISKADES